MWILNLVASVVKRSFRSGLSDSVIDIASTVLSVPKTNRNAHTKRQTMFMNILVSPTQL